MFYAFELIARSINDELDFSTILSKWFNNLNGSNVHLEKINDLHLVFSHYRMMNNYHYLDLLNTHIHPTMFQNYD